MTSRGIALGVGIAFVMLTALELLLGEAAIGEVELLRRTTKVNIFHWGIALAMLGAFFAGSEGVGRSVMRIAGLALLAATLWGIFWPEELGSFLGFSGVIPTAYSVYHGAAAALTLSVGFLDRRRTA